MAGAFLMELRDKSIRSSVALETAVRLPIIGRIPRLSVRERKEAARMVTDGNSGFGRAIADLQAQLLLSASTKVLGQLLLLLLATRKARR